MAKEKVEKTNAIRALDRAKIPYQIHTYSPEDGAIDGISVAEKTGMPAEKVFKTLVTVGHSKTYYVFVLPVAKELNLKAAARSVGEKSVELIPVADINRITGYIRGGCSPVGMKKQFSTIIDTSCLKLDSMVCSAGKIGMQMELEPKHLLAFLQAQTADITAE